MDGDTLWHNGRNWVWVSKGTDGGLFLEGTVPRSTLTPVNSVPHFISYLRRHGLWSPPASHV